MNTVDTYPSRSPTEICWEEIAYDDHSVQIYADSQSFLDALEGFASGGLRIGESVIVIATEPHRRALERKLSRRGFNLEQAALDNRYIAVDAAVTLNQFMVDGHVDSEKFNDCVMDLFTRASGNGRRVRAFGEMVALLWKQGDHASTIELESLWNEFSSRVGLCLFCAYPRSAFTDAHQDSLHTICAHHSRIIPE
ncbi:MAG: MEDS domain-containing protein [Thiobacillus sp.]|nr:MEDS domain-containing protein [Thiobacillus sp.]